MIRIIPFSRSTNYELSFFTDAGMAWDSNNNNLSSTTPTVSKYRYPMISYGVSLRINVLGFMILEPYYAIPIQINGIKYAGLGFNFLPGW